MEFRTDHVQDTHRIDRRCGPAGHLWLSRTHGAGPKESAKIGTNIGDKGPELAYMNADSTKVLKLSN
jgi:hypothetical protein